MNKDNDLLEDDVENPIWTEADFEKAQPAQNVLPKEFFEEMNRARKQPKPKKHLKSDQ